MKTIGTLFLNMLILLGLFNQLNAQQVKPCYTPDVISHFEQTHPGYQLKISNAFEQSKQIVNEWKSSRATNADTLYKIPVVVHIVYTASGENIPDSLIYSQIEVLNRDYNRWNDDAVQTRDVFKPIAGSMHIEFFLATIDPQGNPSTGIIRKSGNPANAFIGFNAFQDNVKDPVEGDAPWNTDKYLNIWVCNLNTLPLGILGYAYPPTGASNWPAGSETDSNKQGVVIDYTAFGRNNPNVIDPTVVPGRTCVHEVGHYLGLRHIWADEAACADDDGINDTPKAGDQSNFDCDTTKNTCVDAGIDYPDMIENYMDYSDERCQNMFTREQTDMMLANLITLRPQLAIKKVVGVGIHNTLNQESISIYPNPVEGVLQIKFNNEHNLSTHLNIYNHSGMIVYSTEITNSNTSEHIDLSSFESGMYYVQLSNAEAVYRSKIIKF